MHFLLDNDVEVNSELQPFCTDSSARRKRTGERFLVTSGHGEMQAGSVIQAPRGFAKIDEKNFFFLDKRVSLIYEPSQRLIK